jgi:hypothetical protein
MAKNAVTAQPCIGKGQASAWEQELTSDKKGISDYIVVPHNIGLITVTVSFGGGGSGYVETTTARNYQVSENDDVVWEKWPPGYVATTRRWVFAPCTAIRIVQKTSGIMKMTARMD